MPEVTNGESAPMAEEADNQRSDAEQQHQSLSSSTSEGGIGTFVKQAQAPFGGFSFPNGDFQRLPIMYPAFYPGFLQQNQEQNHGRGLYAMPPFPFMGPNAAYPPNTLIPFTYSLPTQSASETRGVGEDQGQLGQQQQLPQQLQPPAQGQGVRRYQTGALAPLMRWLSQGMQRAAAPPQPPRPAVRADNVHAPGREGNENAPPAEGQPRGENENQPVDGDNRGAENDPAVEHGGAEGGQRWWGIVKEIQMIVFGFITSLLPGFHNID